MSDNRHRLVKLAEELNDDGRETCAATIRELTRMRNALERIARITDSDDDRNSWRLNVIAEGALKSE